MKPVDGMMTESVLFATKMILVMVFIIYWNVPILKSNENSFSNRTTTLDLILSNLKNCSPVKIRLH